MAINRLPSAWDYAAEGISGFNEGRERKRKKQMEDFNVINQLYQSGAATSDQLSTAGRSSGIPSLANFTALPSAQERKDRAVVQSSQPVGNVPQISGMPMRQTPNLTTLKPDEDLAAEVAGVTTPTARATARTQLSVAQTNAGAQKQDITNRQNKDADALFEDAGQRFVSKYVDPDRISSRDRQKAVDAAFNDYKTVRSSSSMGQIPDEAYAKSFFDKAFTDALRDKANRDLQLKMRLDGRISEQDRLYAQLETTRAHVKDQMDDLANRDKMLIQFKIGNPQYAEDANVKAYERLRDQVARLEAAQVKLLPGAIGATVAPPKGPAPIAEAAPKVPVQAEAKGKKAGFSEKVDDIIATLGPITDSITLAAALKNIKEAKGKYITQDEAAEAEKRIYAKWRAGNGGK